MYDVRSREVERLNGSYDAPPALLRFISLPAGSTKTFLSRPDVWDPGSYRPGPPLFDL